MLPFDRSNDILLICNNSWKDFLKNGAVRVIELQLLRNQTIRLFLNHSCCGTVELPLLWMLKHGYLRVLIINH